MVSPSSSPPPPPPPPLTPHRISWRSAGHHTQPLLPPVHIDSGAGSSYLLHNSVGTASLGLAGLALWPTEGFERLVDALAAATLTG